MYTRKLKVTRGTDAITFEKLEKYNDVELFKKQLIAEGKLIKWERTDWNENNEAFITIQCDNEASYKEITDFSTSLGDWHPNYLVVPDEG